MSAALAVSIIAGSTCLAQQQAAIEGLVKQLTSDSSNDMKRRPQTRDRLIAIGKPAVPELSKLMSHKDANVRINAVIALGRIRSPEPLGVMTKLLEDNNFGIRYRTILAIGDICSPGSRTVASHWKPEFVTPVNRVFGILMSKRREEEIRVASACLAKVFGISDPFRIREIELKADADAKKLVRERWQKWLKSDGAKYGLREEPPIEELLARIRAGSAREKGKAATLLAERQNPAHIPKLLSAAKATKDEGALKAIVPALSSVSGIPVGPWANRKELAKRLEAFELWYNARAYIEALQSDKAKERLAAVEALGKTKHANVTPTLAKHLETETSAHVLKALRDALTASAGEAPEVVFFLSAKDRAPWIDMWIKWLGVKGDVPKLASKKDEQVQKAVDALTQVNFYRVVDALVAELGKAATEDRAKLFNDALTVLRPRHRIAIYGDTTLREIKQHVGKYRTQWKAERDVTLTEPLLRRLAAIKDPKLFVLCEKHMQQVSGHKPKVPKGKAKAGTAAKVIKAWQQWLKQRKQEAGKAK